MSAARRLLRAGLSPSAGAVVLGYHDVVGDDRTANGLTVSAPALDGHITLMRQMGMSFVSAGELVDRLEAGRAITGCAVVTFDDAFVGVHRFALPVLAANDVHATVFTVAEGLGGEPPWWPGQGRTMTAAEVEEVVEAGHEIGSHTSSHCSLTELGPGRLEAELVESKALLGRLAGRPVDLLAYPSGHHDDSVRSRARAAGYRAGFTFLNGRVVGDEDIFRIPRLTMGAHMTRVRLAYHLLRSSDSWPDHQLDRVTASLPEGGGGVGEQGSQLSRGGG
jgi:peptidoglycan/xylan/chitin deacetylase (PgdA/CDA1 family)